LQFKSVSLLTGVNSRTEDDARYSNEQPAAYGSIYSATKAAVNNISISLSKELGPKQIRVNALNRGLVIRGGLRAEDFMEGERYESAVKGTPLGRAGQPDDIGKIALFSGFGWSLLDHRAAYSGRRWSHALVPSRMCPGFQNRHRTGSLAFPIGVFRYSSCRPSTNPNRNGGESASFNHYATRYRRTRSNHGVDEIRGVF
jgi:hypothetical protein